MARRAVDTEGYVKWTAAVFETGARKARPSAADVRSPRGTGTRPRRRAGGLRRSRRRRGAEAHSASWSVSDGGDEAGGQLFRLRSAPGSRDTRRRRRDPCLAIAPPMRTTGTPSAKLGRGERTSAARVRFADLVLTDRADPLGTRSATERAGRPCRVQVARATGPVSPTTVSAEPSWPRSKSGWRNGVDEHAEALGRRTRPANREDAKRAAGLAAGRPSAVRAGRSARGIDPHSGTKGELRQCPSRGNQHHLTGG